MLLQAGSFLDPESSLHGAGLVVGKRPEPLQLFLLYVSNHGGGHDPLAAPDARRTKGDPPNQRSNDGGRVAVTDHAFHRFEQRMVADGVIREPHYPSPPH